MAGGRTQNIRDARIVAVSGGGLAEHDTNGDRTRARSPIRYSLRHAGNARVDGFDQTEAVGMRRLDGERVRSPEFLPSRMVS